MAIRLATYHNGSFKEGVSLTIYDELTGWEKPYGLCGEPRHVTVTFEVTITAYIFTYYAIASGMVLAAVNYIVIGLSADDVDHLYQPSWGIWCSLVVVFNLFGSMAFSMARHQLKEETFWRAILQA
ncbi:hypothetical protein AB5N19_00209 [Seiridium cardinale]